MRKIILASQSPRRRELLTQIGLEYEVCPSTVEEIIKDTNPVDIVKSLSLQKAMDVAEKKKIEYPKENLLVIGADTIVVYDNKILGKPKDEKDAVAMLSLLQGKTHSVYTGVALVFIQSQALQNTSEQEEEIKSFAEETKVTMCPMTQAEILWYVGTSEPMDKTDIPIWNTDITKRPWFGKAGGYGIQDAFGMKYIKSIQGDYYNVVGLPVSRLFQEIKERI